MANRWKNWLGQQIPLAKTLAVGGADFWRSLNFWMNKTDREEMYAIFENCKNLEDYFQFSSKMFGLDQIKDEIIAFLEFAKAEKLNYVCEIGTARGGNTFLLGQALPSTRFILALDLHVRNKSQLHYFSYSSKTISFINGSSKTKSTIDKVKSILGSNKIDLLFIDGDHTYNGVKQDFLNYKNIVQEGGIIVFHDIVPDYRTRYGIETKRWVGDVPLFWSKIKQKYPHYEFVKNPEQDGFGIGAIRYSAQIDVPDNL